MLLTYLNEFLLSRGTNLSISLNCSLMPVLLRPASGITKFDKNKD